MARARLRAPQGPRHPIVWAPSTKAALLAMPAPVRTEIGNALDWAQAGSTHPHAKPMKGFGGGSVLEVVENFDGDTFRAVYTVKIKGKVYVLHVFQKKAKSGIKTPKADVDLIKQRLAAAQARERQMLARYERKELTMSRRKAEHGPAEVEFEEGSTNVFADIGLEDADELQMRAELARHLCLAIRSMNWSVSQAARELGIERARVSELMNGRLGGFSLERLGRYLTRLNRDIVIKVVKRRRRGRWQVAA